MGSNVGTTVTNTVVSMVLYSEKAKLRRAFTAAVMHDMFNFYSTVLIFPVDQITGGGVTFLTKQIVGNYSMRPKSLRAENSLALITKPKRKPFARIKNADISPKNSSWPAVQETTKPPEDKEKLQNILNILKDWENNNTHPNDMENCSFLEVFNYEKMTKIEKALELLERLDNMTNTNSVKYEILTEVNLDKIRWTTKIWKCIMNLCKYVRRSTKVNSFIVDKTDIETGISLSEIRRNATTMFENFKQATRLEDFLADNSVFIRSAFESSKKKNLEDTFQELTENSMIGIDVIIKPLLDKIIKLNDFEDWHELGALTNCSSTNDSFLLCDWHKTGSELSLAIILISISTGLMVILVFALSKFFGHVVTKNLTCRKVLRLKNQR